jgi:hypothetical protein
MKAVCKWHGRIDSLAPSRAATKGGRGEEDPRAGGALPRYSACDVPGPRFLEEAARSTNPEARAPSNRRQELRIPLPFEDALKAVVEAEMPEKEAIAKRLAKVACQ